MYNSYAEPIDTIVQQYADYIILCCGDHNLPKMSWSNDHSS